MADNVYIPGVGGELVKKDADGNTYKLRELKDGTKHLILKNYFSKDELVEIFESCKAKINPADIFYGEFYWFLSYMT